MIKKKRSFLPGMQFDGRIVEFPEVRVDSFANLPANVRYGFISHAHTDHLSGLASVSNMVIYTTEITKQLIRSSGRYDCILEQIKVQPFNRPFYIGKQRLKVTFISNYHCMGSAMVLFESPTCKVLYTGDIRLDSTVISTLKTNVHLLKYMTGRDWLDNLYLDTTFSYRNRNIELIDRSEGIEKLISLVSKYPRGTTFRLLNTTCGFEEVWFRLAVQFGIDSVVVADADIRRRFDLLRTVDRIDLNPVDDFNDLLNGEILRQEPKYTFYIGRYDADVTVTAAVDITSREFQYIHSPKRLEEFDQIQKVNDGYIGRFIYDNVEFRKTYLHNAGLYLPTDVKFVFSRHSSCSECLEYVSLFQGLREVYPMVFDMKSWMRGFTMQRYFSFATVTNSFRFDREMQLLYGPSPVAADESVKIVDCWKHSDGIKFLGQVKNRNVPNLGHILITNDREVRLQHLDQHMRSQATVSSGESICSSQQYEGAVLAKTIEPHSVVIACSMSTDTDSGSITSSNWDSHAVAKRHLSTGSESTRKRILKII